MNKDICKVGKKIVVLSIAAISVWIVCSSMTTLAEAPPLGPYTLYGSATLDGELLTAADTNVVISIEVDAFGEVASYTMGSNPAMGDMYKLQVNVYAGAADGPMQGDTAHIYITKTVKSEILEGPQEIGAPFSTVELDISAVSDTEPPIIALKAGWNLISLPLMPDNVSIEAVIPAGQAADGDWIYADKPGAGLSWKDAYYSAGAWHGTLTNFAVGEGCLYNRAGSTFDWIYGG